MVWWRRRERDRQPRQQHSARSGRGNLLKSVLEPKGLDPVEEGRRQLSDLAGRSRGALERGSSAVSSLKAKDVLPFVASCATSLAVQCSVLKGCQVASAALLRVSCATPVLSTIVGGSAVALASVASGTVSRAIQQPLAERGWREDGSGLGIGKFRDAVGRTTTTKDVLIDAALGFACFSAIGGRIRSVLPSDVRYPGANANASMPAVGAAYATKFQRAELLRMLRSHGCHHCGKRSGPVIADHMPPNLFVDKAKTRGGIRRALTKMRWGGSLSQRFFPQCRGCSQKQAVAVKKDRKTLVLHLSKWHPHYLAGPLVASRTFDQNKTENVLRNFEAAKHWMQTKIEG